MIKVQIYKKKVTRVLVILTLLVLNFSFVCAQNKVTGKVVDGSGEPMIGVSVLEKGTANGVITDIEGGFSLNVEQGGILQFSFVGFQTQEVKVNASFISIVLEEDNNLLEEVVVVGYGTLKKKDLTGSLSSVDSKMLVESNQTNLGAALQGQVAGMDLVKSGNKPGSGYHFMIRGVNKISGQKGNDEMTDIYDVNPPLFVVDGMFVSSINDIAPEDIERIDVLKDASSTAIYGSRGANGVVIVSTKRGTGDRSYVEYNGSLTISNPMNLPDMMNGQEYAQYRIDRRLGENYNIPDYQVDLQSLLGAHAYDNYINGRSTDWPDLIFKTAVSHSHNARIYGGSKGLSYTFGLSYVNDKGIIGSDRYQRYNLSTSIDKKLGEYVHTGVNLYTAYEISKNSGTETFRSAYRLNPLTDVYDEEGNLKLFPDATEAQVTNPLLEMNEVQTEYKKIHVFGNVYMKIKPLKWLEFSTTLTPDVEFSRYGEHRGLESKTAIGDQNKTRGIYNTSNHLKYTWDNIINISHTFNDIHKLNGLLGMSWYKRNNDWNNNRADGIPNDFYQWYNLGSGNMKSMETGYVQEQLLSYFSRLNYSYKERYLITATGRFDGSSRLAPGHKWEFFPSFALAWRISEESFMKNVNFLNDLKLRLSYGVSGNDAVSPYMTNLYVGNSKYIFGDNGFNSAYIRNLASKTLTWEKTKEWNLGLDYTFFNGRLSGSIDLYTRKTSDILMDRKISEVNGFDKVIDNVGSMRNQGLELVLNTVNIKTENFTWSTNINFTTNKNEIVQLSSGAIEDRANQWFVGESMGAIWTYKHIGFWSEDEVAKGLAPEGFNAGSIKVLDRDGNNEITDDDKVILGSPFPKWTAGMTNTFKYKDFDLSIFVNTRQGQWAHSQFHRTFTFGDRHSFNVVKLNYWTPENQKGAEWYRPGISNQNVGDAVLYTKTSYVKIGHINLGYNVPKKIIEKLGVNKLRLHASCQNPFIFTDYIGWDPEAASQNSYTQYPMLRSFVFGINMAF